MTFISHFKVLVLLNPFRSSFIRSCRSIASLYGRVLRMTRDWRKMDTIVFLVNFQDEYFFLKISTFIFKFYNIFKNKGKLNFKEIFKVNAKRISIWRFLLSTFYSCHLLRAMHRHRKMNPSSFLHFAYVRRQNFQKSMAASSPREPAQ